MEIPPEAAGPHTGRAPESVPTHPNLHLLRELVRRDFTVRFTGSVLGLLWAVLQPLSLVALYWFVFTYMFTRAPGAGSGYLFFLICGLIPWMAINEGLIRSTTSIVENAAIVRKLSFRSELLVIVPNVSAMIFECVALVIFLAFLVVKGSVPSRPWLLPIALVLQLAAQVGIGFALAAIYVFFRDLTQIIGFLLSVIFYLSPILYPVSQKFALFFRWNPMTPLLGLYRSALLPEPLPELSSVVFLLIVALLLLGGGIAFFRRAQPTLVDLI